MEVEREDCQTVEKKAGKPCRRRKKALYAKIREQMEFYFSDANLHKDRFLKKSIQATSDGYISLDVFLQCNKIKCLTDEVGMIADALDSKSQLLQINPERTHVKRVTPIKEPVNVDERTVYVESLPNDVDHEWVKKLFSSCGKVVYVSLPRYPSTGDLKGFGFVEFETIEGAEAACKELNNPPAEDTDKAGMFPKSSHQMDALRKKLPEEEINKTVEKVKDIISTDDQDQKENVTSSETPNKDSDKNTDKETKGKRHRTNSESDSAANSDASPTKRKRSDVSFDHPGEELKTADEKTTASKKRSRKRKGRSKTAESEESKGESDLDRSCDVPEKKQKLSEKSDVNVLSEPGTEETNLSERSEKSLEGQQHKEHSSKKKKRFRRKKDKKEKEIPELRVLPKKEWLVLRDEYLKLQKTSMALLKKTLREHQDPTKKGLDGVKRLDKKRIEFKPDVIVKVRSEEPMRRKTLKSALGEGYKIAYIDVKDEHTEGYIRCEDSESAKQIGTATISGYSFTNMRGEEEKQYWDKLTLDRETKLSTKCRHKKRGHQKWTEKAQKASIENIERKHIVFEDDEYSKPDDCSEQTYPDNNCEHPNPDNNYEHPNLDNYCKHPNPDNYCEHPNPDNNCEHPYPDNYCKHPNPDNYYEHPNLDNYCEQPNLGNNCEHPNPDNDCEHPNPDNNYEHPNPDNYYEHPNPDNNYEHRSLDNNCVHPNPDNYCEHPNPDNYCEHPKPDNYCEHPNPDNYYEHSNPDNYYKHPNLDIYCEHPNLDNYCEHLIPDNYSEHPFPTVTVNSLILTITVSTPIPQLL